MITKSKFSALSVFGLTILLSSHSQAGVENGCSTAPKSKFKDRSIIDDMLKPNGLMINKIIEEKGCYKVIAVTREFKKTTLYFNAETLKQIDLKTSNTSDEDAKDNETYGD